MLRSTTRLVGNVLFVLVLVACAQSTPKPVATRPRPTPLPTSTPLPPLPTLPPAGSADNPVVFLLVNPDGKSVTAKADALAKTISDELKLVVQVKIAATYGEARAAMCSGEASVISADAFAYLSAVEQDCGDGLYIAEVDGSTGTQGEMLAGLGRSIFSIKSFRGYRFCRPDAMSVNGWFVPTLSLKANEVDPLGDLDSVIDSGSDVGVIKDIIALKCDVGAARLGAEENVPGAKSVLVIDKLPLVPNDTIMISSRLEGRARGLVGDNIRDHLDDIAGLIGADGLVTADDKKFDDLRQLFSVSNVDVLSMGN
jgi:ABC-type phosphate/phosphonate transport system substrate-binding protein